MTDRFEPAGTVRRPAFHGERPEAWEGPGASVDGRLTPPPRPPFKVGDPVAIHAGEHAGFVAFMYRKGFKTWLAIRVQGRPAPLYIAADDCRHARHN
jgi:hypothetical protein